MQRRQHKQVRHLIARRGEVEAAQVGQGSDCLSGKMEAAEAGQAYDGQQNKMKAAQAGQASDCLRVENEAKEARVVPGSETGCRWLPMPAVRGPEGLGYHNL